MIEGARNQQLQGTVSMLQFAKLLVTDTKNQPAEDA